MGIVFFSFIQDTIQFICIENFPNKIILIVLFLSRTVLYSGRVEGPLGKGSDHTNNIYIHQVEINP